MGKGKRNRDRKTDEPRKGGGSIVGPGGPTERMGVMFDSRLAILVEKATLAVAHTTQNGEPGPDNVAIVWNGRINRPPDDEIARERPAEPIEHLHMLSWELAADVVVEIQALAARDGFDLNPLLEKGWAKLEAEGLTTRVPD